MANFWRGLGWTVATVGVAGVVLRLALFKVWTVPDDERLAAAVSPTLAAGDTVLVLTRGTPTFGDLVRCPDPDDPTHYTVARIAGVPGDAVEAHGRFLTVNGRKYQGESACPQPTYTVKPPGNTTQEVEIACDEVTMGGGWHYRGYRPKMLEEPITRADVKPGTVFLLSDDRDYHDDSRDYGALDASLCKERIIFRLWGKGGWSDDKRRMTMVR